MRIGSCLSLLPKVVDMITYGTTGLLFGVPMAVTFYENVGGPAKVSGPSMRVRLYLYSECVRAQLGTAPQNSDNTGQGRSLGSLINGLVVVRLHSNPHNFLCCIMKPCARVVS